MGGDQEYQLGIGPVRAGTVIVRPLDRTVPSAGATDVGVGVKAVLSQRAPYPGGKAVFIRPSHVVHHTLFIEIIIRRKRLTHFGAD